MVEREWTRGDGKYDVKTDDERWRTRVDSKTAPVSRTPSRVSPTGTPTKAPTKRLSPRKSSRRRTRPKKRRAKPVVRKLPREWRPNVKRLVTTRSAAARMRKFIYEVRFYATPSAARADYLLRCQAKDVSPFIRVSLQDFLAMQLNLRLMNELIGSDGEDSWSRIYSSYYGG